MAESTNKDPREAPCAARPGAQEAEGQPLRLYHGTSSTHLDRILTHGIAPRRVSRTRTNWQAAPSHHEMVYLTSAYPLYFAAAALTPHAASALLVLDVAVDELDEALLYPDEDFLTSVLVAQRQASLAQAKRETKRLLQAKRHLWRNSLAALGTCCFRGTIPAHALIRYALIDQRQRVHLVFEAMQPSITPTNYRLMGDYYRQFLAWIFAERETLPQVQRAHQQLAELTATPEGEEPLPPELRQQHEGAVTFWEAESQNRTGITVRTL